MNINVDIDPQELARNIGQSDAIDLILEMDKAFADCSFTLDLLKKLIQSLEGDMGKEEIIAEINSMLGLTPE